MAYQFETNIPKDEYDTFVKNNPLCNLLQSYNWAKVKDNWDHIYTGVYDHKELVAAGLVLIRNLPLHMTMFYIPRGPILDYNNERLVGYYFQELKRIAKKRHCLFIKFDPTLHVNDYASKDYNENRYESTQKYLDTMKKIGAVHHGFTMNIADTVQPRFQSNVYDTEGWEENLPKHTKRLIKDANRRNVEIVTGGIELVDEFSRLVEMTEERKHVALRNKEYFEKLMKTYPDGGVIFLAKCNVHRLAQEAKEKKELLLKELDNLPENTKKKRRRLEDQLRSNEKDLKEFNEVIEEFGDNDKEIAIAGILSIQYGPTCEMLYAGMDQRFKKFMPQYKEYVENFRWAFERGCKWSNMGGVEGSLDDGLTKFKDNFNPVINEFIGEFDLPVNKALFKMSEKAYTVAKSRAKEQ
ncbi:MAG: peptidoglycan bridge formation glycyltransferase FemA/FemB family protein [Absicoccus porci]|uniref:peptidoglycan bridge formation glycyltransferase FemA/FemB family protein n=1 Tax=Absicoccus porci TaxID=2486576 RepID=UPI002E768F58|nr:peptidoglycan bridge formation glycyltransferase FemA/FemB family protein [Absicoccus porci]MEE1354362.1 peptidoglycan bridge formation glycyltransferase FemA/FemB family protein [Absicoccus porci]